MCNVNFCGIPSLITFDDQNKYITEQITAKGYDNMTGIGTPRGQSFINLLRKMGVNNARPGGPRAPNADRPVCYFRTRPACG